MNLPTLHLLQLQVPILEQLQIEEALLRADQRNWCVLNTGSPPAIVMGISSRLEDMVNSQRLTQKPVPVIRRFSGGGTVFVDENTEFVTFIFNSQHVPVSPFPEPIMRWTETVYQPVFFPLPFRLQENDYVLDQWKCGGNAQSICKYRWLHHSSFLWDYCEQNMDYLHMPKKIPSYRQQRTHRDFLCRLKDYWTNRQEFKAKILTSLEQSFNVCHVKVEEIQDLLTQPHRKSTVLIQDY